VQSVHRPLPSQANNAINTCGGADYSITSILSAEFDPFRLEADSAVVLMYIGLAI
jgi:hypothetical protein